jgi:hypothetical protein
VTVEGAECGIDRPFSDQNSKYKQIKYYYLLTN